MKYTKPKIAGGLTLSFIFFCWIYEAFLPLSIPSPDREKTWLILGVDNHTFRKVFQTDIIMLLKKTPSGVKLLSIPRGLIVHFPGCMSGTGGMIPINVFSYAESGEKSWDEVKPTLSSEGSLDLLHQCLSTVLGIPIDEHLILDSGSLIKLVNSMGGITVNVQHSFKEMTHPAYELQGTKCIGEGVPENSYACRLKEIEFAVGTQHMSGEQALAFIRSRKNEGDPGATARETRALEVVQALLGSTTIWQKITAVVTGLSVLHTNASTVELSKLLWSLKSLALADIQFFNLSKALADARSEQTLGGIEVTDGVRKEIRTVLTEQSWEDPS